MSWISGSGFGSWILKSILGNKSFQDAITSAVQYIGQSITDNVNHPDKLIALAKNLKDNPKAVVGAIVKGTEAEQLVDPSVVAAADEVKAPPT